MSTLCVSEKLILSLEPGTPLVFIATYDVRMQQKLIYDGIHAVCQNEQYF